MILFCQCAPLPLNNVLWTLLPEAGENINDESWGQIGQGIGAAAVTINRDEYLQAYRDLMFDRNQAQIKNNLLHRRLAEYYK